MPDRGKGGFNRIAGADALPMLGREVEECHEFGPILLQAQCRLGVFGFVGFDEQIKGLVRVVLGLGLPASRDIAAQYPAGQWILCMAALAFG